MAQLSGMDTIFLNLESRGLPMHVSSLIMADPTTAPKGEVTFNHIKALVSECLVENLPILKSKIKETPFMMDLPYWVKDEDFDLSNHLKRIHLNKPGDRKALMELTGELHEKPLDRSRALWEIYFIEGLDNVEGLPKGSIAIVTKFHHTIMDGRTGMQIMMHLLSMGADKGPIALSEEASLFGITPDNSAANNDFYSNVSSLDMMRNSYVNNAKKTWGLTKLLGSQVPSAINKVNQVKKEQRIKPAPIREKTRFNQKVSTKRVVDNYRIPLDEIKAIKNTLEGVKVNDVILAIVGGSMRRYLEQKNELPNSTLIATAPIDVRSEQDSNITGNMINLMNVPVRSDIADPMKRLEAIAEESQAAKSVAEAMGDKLTYNFLQNMFPSVSHYGIQSLINSPIMDKMEPVAHTVVSNIPSIPIPVYLAGAKLEESMGMGPCVPHNSLFHTISGINGMISICFNACGKALPDPDVYKECLEAAYNELKEAAAA